MSSVTNATGQRAAQRAPCSALRAGSSSSVARFCSGVISIQSEISASVRKHPRHKPERCSMKQTPMQGEGTSGIRAVMRRAWRQTRRMLEDTRARFCSRPAQACVQAPQCMRIWTGSSSAPAEPGSRGFALAGLPMSFSGCSNDTGRSSSSFKLRPLSSPCTTTRRPR